MKRTIFVVIALFVLIAPAAAQSNTEKPQLRMTAAQVEQCVQSPECIKTMQASKVSIVTETPAAVSAPVVRDGRWAAIEYRLSRYSVSKEEKEVVIERLLTRYPNAFDAGGGVSSSHEINAMDDEINQLINVQELEKFNQLDRHMAAATSSQTSPYGATGTPDCANWNRQGQWTDPREEPWIEANRRRVCGNARMGYLKINAVGDTDFARYLTVLRKDEDGDWIPVGSGGKAFRVLHDPMELPVGKHKLRFELRRGGFTQYLEETFVIESKYDRKNPFVHTMNEEVFRSFSQTVAITRQ